MVVFTEEVVRICNEQWEFFDRGRRKEYQKKVFRRVGDFWSEGADVSGRTGRSQVDFGNLDRDNPEVIVPDSRNKNPPWSAAFISFVAKTAGAGNRFKYSGAHATYILAALDAAANSNTTAKFIARRHTQQRPQIGDLIACGRERAKTATFDTVRDFVVEGFFPSHCDFVVEIGDDFVRTIGGNVGHSVARKNWPLNTQGRIGDKDPQSPTANVICIIDCLLP